MKNRRENNKGAKEVKRKKAKVGNLLLDRIGGIYRIRGNV
jgi:hypothetical protein